MMFFPGEPCRVKPDWTFGEPCGGREGRSEKRGADRKRIKTLQSSFTDIRPQESASRFPGNSLSPSRRRQMFCRKSLFLTGLFIMFSFYGCSSIYNIRKAADDQDLKNKNSLVIMTYNIRMGGGSKNPDLPPQKLRAPFKNLDNLVKAIRSVDPDIVALQEVPGFYQAKYLARELRMNFVYSGHGDKKIKWGLAILSKFKLSKKEIRSIYYPGSVPVDPRIGLEARIDVNGTPISIFNVQYHLGNYESQVEATIRAIKRFKGPHVLLGDFNCPASAYELMPISNSMVETCRAVQTAESMNASRRGTLLFGNSKIDHIFVNSESFEVQDAGIIAEEHWNASDHMAFFARVVLKNR
jgi:endonuclease/exonuclease/phosphatase family metal-dependent hydrolase